MNTQLSRIGILICYLALTCNCIITASNLNTRQFSMRSINANTGLSNSAVTSLCQDTDGTLWIGTWDGLNKYDGETYIQYRHINNVSSSLSHQVVRNIAEEDSTHIWISTDYGINRLNKVTGQCSQYYLSYGKQYIYQENVFLCDASLNANAVVAALRGQTLLIYNKETDSFTPENSIYDINQLFFDNDGKLWVVCQQNSLYCLTINETKANVDYTTYLNDDVKSSLHYDGKDKIWFINADILNYINVRTREIISTDVKMLDETHLSSAISLNDSSTLLGNTNGSYILQHEKLIPILDTEVSVLSLLQGQNGEIWIGTDGKGIIQLYEKNNSIRYYPSQDFQESDNFAIRSILNVSDSMLWVGSKGGGLTLIELLNENESHPIMNYNVGYGKTNNSVFSLAKNGETLWVGTDGQGLLYLSDKTRGIQKLRFSDEKLHFDKASVYCILFANNNTLFAGTSGQGLYRIVLDENNVATEIEQFYHDDTNPESIGSNVVYDLLDDGNYIWIATRGGGLCRMNKQTYELNSYKSIIGDTTSLCSNDVISICLDRNNRIWVGTTTGLSYGTRIGSDYKFTSLDEKNGLPNTNIHFISEDGNGYIWVSTSHGLARINESTLNITPYYYEDGLQSNEFSDGSGCHCDKSDIIYFGGVNGLNCIHTSDLHESAEMPNMILSGVSDGEKIYESLDGTYHIGYKVSTIKFNFSIIEYINNKKCQFAYRLQRQSGFIPSVETPWINLGTQREVILSGLSSGTYKLEVTCSNANRLWGNSQTYMFMIDTPWWLSAWAIISYIFIVFGIVFIMVQHRQKSLKMQHDLELSKRDRQNKENVHQAKLRFFTNIAHEFSNSITLIYGAAEQLLSNTTDPNIKRQLTSIHGNAERMHNQIQELMEFRKAETGHLVLQYEPIDIPELINITADDFLTIADEQQIELSINISSALSTWVTDRSKLEKIIFNFLSNAVKYTPEHGYIKLNAGIIDQKLSISVTNNGPGIKSSELENIFNRFTVLDNFEKKLTQGHYSRTGIGLALCKDLVKLMGGTISADSKENEYTTFRVLLPQNEITEINQNTEIPKLEKQNNVFEEIIRENRQTILIVDDQQDICQLICEIIGDEYETITVHNGEEALEAITHKTPNLIISDILMPKMNGIELINHLKKQEAYKYIPIIILSSKTDMESQIETLNIGASLFIGKPFHPRYLKTAIENMLSNSTMMKQFSGTSAAYMERFNDSMISKDDRELMNRIIEDLNANYSDEDYDQHQLAENLALSDMQLYRRLKKIAKITPSDFIRSYRIRQAEQMLINSDKTIQEIMVNCGFHNKAYFYRIFAETHNCSPKEYRENKK